VPSLEKQLVEICRGRKLSYRGLALRFLPFSTFELIVTLRIFSTAIGNGLSPISVRFQVRKKV